MGILKFIAFCAQIDFFLGLELQHCESQRADTFCITMVDYKIHFQKISALTTPKTGGHFSCRKPVSHVGTSTVSDSEALIHLAYVQHMWQSKFVVILEGLTRWRIELC